MACGRGLRFVTGWGSPLYRLGAPANPCERVRCSRSGRVRIVASRSIAWVFSACPQSSSNCWAAWTVIRWNVTWKRDPRYSYETATRCSDRNSIRLQSCSAGTSTAGWWASFSTTVRRKLIMLSTSVRLNHFFIRQSDAVGFILAKGLPPAGVPTAHASVCTNSYIHF